MRSSRKLFVAIAAAGLVAAGGSAFTATNTLEGDNVAGYGTAAVSGATSTAIEHTLSGDGKTILSTLITFSTDLNTGHNVKAGFGSSSLEGCTVNEVANTATCAYGTPYDTELAGSFNVAVS